MKRIKVFMLVAAITTFIFAGTLAVSASPTDLSSLKIYAVDASGTKTEVPIDFKSTVYSYDITIKNDAQTIELDYVTEDSTSQAQILNEQFNLKMDEGKNKTEIQVTAADRTTGKYTINTTKLTAAESESFSYDEKPATTATKTDDKDAVKVKVGKKTFKVSKTIKGDVPKGFEKDKYKYKGKKYECIVKGDETHLVALYLYNSKTEGFYVYNESDDSFYELKNINIASRMYTIVHVDDVAKILKNYEKEKIEIEGTTVKAWVLDEDEDLYLVYAMNWDEEVNLYCYDAREKVFQRYPISEDSFAQKEAAEVAYTNLQTNRNHLAKKYNWLLKIAGALIIIIIILVFIIINMKIAKKSKKLENEDDADDEDESDDFEFVDLEDESDEEKNEEAITKKDKKADTEKEKSDVSAENKSEGDNHTTDNISEDDEVTDITDDISKNTNNESSGKKSKKALKKEKKRRKAEEKKQRKLQEEDELLMDVDEIIDEPEMEKENDVKTEPKSEPKAEAKAETKEEPKSESKAEAKEEPKSEPKAEAKEEPKSEPKAEAKEEPKEEPAKKAMKSKRVKSDRTYGDEPTFGSDKESSEGFYGGEVKAEDDVLIDIADDDSYDNLQETLKSMLPPEDESDDDEDFEFIDLD